MGSGMRTHAQRRDRAYISTLHMQHIFNPHRWIVGPVRHTGMYRDRNIHPIVAHLLYSLLVARADVSKVITFLMPPILPSSSPGASSGAERFVMSARKAPGQR